MFLAGRLLPAPGTILAATVLVFMDVQFLPADVASAVLGRNATAVVVVRINVQLRLDDPLLLRYFEWLRSMLEGDFGHSTAAAVTGQSVSTWSQIQGALQNSLLLAGARSS